MSTPQEIKADVLASIEAEFAKTEIAYPTSTVLCRFKHYDQEATEQALRELVDDGKIKMNTPSGGRPIVTWVDK
ncbi:hypothetical protein [Streptacidiphilus carbonis]|uniref:hypothetical protein n=1 Tax=Streptacidiphilus carbonis TaxID=105422 RepID=UPI0005A72264|nr:hypothetical protein [Streptacidiphilus carbonis]